MDEVSPIPSGFLYLPLWMLGNPVTGSICCSAVIARSTAGVAKDWLQTVVDIGRDW